MTYVLIHGGGSTAWFWGRLIPLLDRPAWSPRWGDRVDRVVLNAALVPPEGGRGLDCIEPAHRDGLILAVQVATRRGETITLPGPPADPQPVHLSAVPRSCA